jgi:hypothetical protein
LRKDGHPTQGLSDRRLHTKDEEPVKLAVVFDTRSPRICLEVVPLGVEPSHQFHGLSQESFTSSQLRQFTQISALVKPRSLVRVRSSYCDIVMAFHGLEIDLKRKT